MKPVEGPDFFLLCGGLGSGKTTLLSDYLAQAEAADTGVIVNEFGEISVDGALIATERPGLNMAYLSNGCVCCSIGNGLRDAVEELMRAKERQGRPLRRIVLETSGLARPGPVVRSLSELRHLGPRLGIVSTYDCRQDWLRGCETGAEATAHIAAAHIVVLTKTDCVDAGSLAGLAGRVGGLNPLARIVVAPDRHDRALQAFSGVLAKQSFFALDEGTGAATHPDVSVLRVRWASPVDWPTVEDWLEDLAGFCGERLLRTKGFLDVAGSSDRVLIQGVGTVFDTPRRIAGARDAPEGLIIILRDLDMLSFQEFLDAVPGSPAIASPSNTAFRVSAQAGGR
ncbi:CobW family GTP-binding protein [Methylobacterium oryzae]|uniref:CobW family GTP-binding protein n=1 Tax=Methylobacterium oryzae TaxID=334852 RepID=UPI001F37B5F2|nr:GTP-binding protein [Methylobacterium oryzae]UIN36901.1 GTP-binding protein [Methylobacterium oryzae]